MSKDLDRLSMIFCKDDLERIIVHPDKEKIMVDLHGKTRKEAKKFLNNIINVIRHPFTLEVIHGYNNGTVLKEMISKEEINSRIVSKVVPFYNVGETILSVA